MNESSTNWVAILTLQNDPGSISKENASEPYILSHEEATFIGRSKDCQIYLRPEFSNTSRYHAKVKLEDVEGEMVWLVWDLETPNGTFVNGQKVERSEQIQSGDSLTLGKPHGARFIFEWKAMELTQLNEVFRQKPAYDETLIPSVSELRELDEQKLAYGRDLADPTVSQLNIGSVNLRLQNSGRGISDGVNQGLFASDSAPDSKKKKLLQWFAKGLAALIFLLVAISLIYQVPASIEAKKRREKSLASYTDTVSKLLLENKLGSLDFSDSDARKARSSANAKTLTTLKTLDGETKGTLLRFLHGAKLNKIQPRFLSEAWLSNPTFSAKTIGQFINNNIIRKELVYVRGLKIDQAKVTSLPVFLSGQIKQNPLNAEKDRNLCTIVSEDNWKTSGCAWILEFKAKSYERPFVTPIQLSGSDLTGVVLKDAPLERINLEGAYISLQNCKQNLSGNFFVDTFYQRPLAWLNRKKCRANFSGSGLQDSRLYRSVLMGANLKNSKLNYADLREADLRGANLSGVSWTGALLAGACYLEDDWQKSFPEKGPNGGKFDPAAEGMKAVSLEESDINDSSSFKECKNIAVVKKPPQKSQPKKPTSDPSS